MSQVGVYRSQIRIIAGVKTYASNIEASPAFQIMQKAMEVVSQQHNGTLSRTVTDYYGRQTECDFAVITQEVPRGVGIKIDRQTGAVNFVFDPYGGYQATAQAITDEITQSYTAIALIRAMKSLGYKVEEEVPQRGQKSVMLVGVM